MSRPGQVSGFSHLYADLPDMDHMPKSRDDMFSDKRELSTLNRHSDLSRQLHEVYASPEFAELMAKMVGEVFLDPEDVSGGFHAGPAGSFLDMHVDFNLHPVNPDWLREFNILLYLDPGWDPSWGGELQLTDDPGRPGVKVQPLSDRLVFMECTDSSFHGYEKISFLPDRMRRSIAAYAFSKVPEGSTVVRHTTEWVPQDGGALKKTLAKNWNRILLSKNMFLDSGTVKNRR